MDTLKKVFKQIRHTDTNDDVMIIKTSCSQYGPEGELCIVMPNQRFSIKNKKDLDEVISSLKEMFEWETNEV